MPAKLLFVCSGNTCRSPLAQAFARTLPPECLDGWIVESAGLFVPHPSGASPGAIAAAALYGLDLSGHTARQLTSAMVTGSELVLVMAAHHLTALKERFPQFAAKIHTLKEFLGGEGNVADPFGGDESVYRATADELRQLTMQLAEKLRQRQ
ncbi:MAG: low molecular weight protein arginine phosphatase [Dethiobacter sp.]|jgi:protein-tyrosine-phosphatase|nr:low molecular weight protein arginine phosphatase [Dethiobacter sp.]